MAAFPPDCEPTNARDLAHVRRWLQDWGDELGVGWEENGELLAAAWARQVEPVLARDQKTGEPLHEVIISVVASARGTGVSSVSADRGLGR
jgi:hypothetical protein